MKNALAWEYENLVRESLSTNSRELSKKFSYLISFPNTIDYWERADIYFDRDTILEFYKNELEELYEFGKILNDSRIKAINSIRDKFRQSSASAR